MSDFMLLTLMSLEEVRKEAISIVNKYPKTKDMPLDYLVRMNLLIADIKKREQQELFDKKKKSEELRKEDIEKQAKLDLEKFQSKESLKDRVKLIRERFTLEETDAEGTNLKNKM